MVMRRYAGKREFYHLPIIFGQEQIRFRTFPLMTSAARRQVDYYMTNATLSEYSKITLQ